MGTEARPPHHQDQEGSAAEAVSRGGDRAGGAEVAQSEIARGLLRLRARARLLLLARAAAILLAGVLVALVVIGLTDFALRTPRAIRATLLLLLIGAMGIGIRRFVVPAWRFRPALREVALRIESTEAGRKAGLTGVLASGLELSDAARRANNVDPSFTALARSMSERVGSETGRLWSPEIVGAVLSLRQSVRALGLLGLALILAIAPAFVRPDLVSIAAARVLTPWSDARWPTRTEVVDLTGARVHPMGESLPLRAALTRTNRREGQTQVLATYRVVQEGRPGPWQTVVLTAQSRRVEVSPSLASPGAAADRAEPSTRPARTGELFERLIDPRALIGTTVLPNEFTLEYTLETDDNQTRPTEVLIVAPATIVGATATIEPPAYARPALAALEPDRLLASRPLGSGADERASVPASLVGSRVELEIQLSKPVPAPGPGEAGFSGFVRGALGLERLPDDLEARFEGDRWSLAWTLSEPTTLRVRPVDEHGISSVDEGVYAFDAIADTPPSASITEPAQDEAVLASATVRITGEGRDDIAVASVAIDRQIARPPARSSGVGADVSEAPSVIAGPASASEPARQRTIDTTLELGELSLQPGDEVWLHAIATDAFVLDGQTHEPARSVARRLRIIAQPELVEQLRAELQSIRQAAIRLDAEQSELRRQLDEEPMPRDLAERQAALGDRIATQRETIERLARRAERNNLEDGSLAGLMGDAASFVAEAARSSQSAAQSIQSRAEPRPEDPETLALDEAAREEIAQAQDDVRDELGQLVQLLDNGQDAWVARRSVERLLAEQRRLLEQTQDLASRTTGRAVDALSQDERTELERIADRQRDAARQAEGALDELSERSRELREIDAAQAQAMALATQRGRSSSVASKLDEASEQISQNQANAAAQRQQEAIQTLEEMLEDLDSADRRRDEALRRQLASIIDSLESLIAQQEAQIALLARGRAGGPQSDLAPGMIRVNQNTLGVLEQIIGAGREMEKVADLTSDAATAQSLAVLSLRAPVNLGEADKQEQTSLVRLRDARAEAERIDKEAAERDAARKRRELRIAYREALEQQTDLARRTEGYEGRELDRRDRAGVRQAGEQQDALRATLALLQSETRELAEARIFAFAHERIDASMAGAAEALRAARVDRTTRRHQETSIRLLQSLMAALEESRDERDFRDQQQGGSEGGGQGGSGNDQLIQDMAKLKLLREMQGVVLETTRAASNDPGAFSQDELVSLGRLQRELAEQGRTLLEEMSRAAGGMPSGRSGGAPEPPPPTGPEFDSAGKASSNGGAP